MSAPVPTDPARHHGARRVLPLVGALLLLAAVVGVLGNRARSVLNDPADDVQEKFGLRDFRDAIYYPAVAFLDGVNPYDSAAYREAYPVRHFPLYAPHSLLLYAPFSVLSQRQAETAYFFLTVGLTVLLAAVALRSCGVRLAAAGVVAFGALLLMSRPGHQNLLNGQSTVQVILGTVMALHFARRRPALAAVGLVLATLKPTFGLPLVVLMICRRDYRAVLLGVGSAAVASLAVLAILAPMSGGLAGLVQSIRGNLGAHGSHPFTNLETSYSRVDAVQLASRALQWIPGTGSQFLIAFLVLWIGGLAVRRLSITSAGRGADSLSSALVCLTILLFFYHQPYDLLVLTLPLVAVLAARRQPWNAVPAGLRWMLAAAMALPAMNYVATQSVLRRLGVEGVAWSLLTMFNGVAVLAAFLVCLWLAFRSDPGAAGG